MFVFSLACLILSCSYKSATIEQNIMCSSSCCCIHFFLCPKSCYGILSIGPFIVCLFVFFPLRVIAKLINAVVAALDPFYVCHGYVLPLACWNNALIVPWVLCDEDLCIMLPHLLFWCMTFVSRWSNRLRMWLWVHLREFIIFLRATDLPCDELKGAVWLLWHLVVSGGWVPTRRANV